MTETLYDVVLTDTEVFVREHSTDNDGEHTTSVHPDYFGACCTGRKLARQFDLNYRKSDDR